MTIRRRLFLWYTGVFAASAAAIMAAFYAISAHKLRSDYERYVLDEYDDLALTTLANLDDLSELRAAIQRATGEHRSFVIVYRLVDGWRGLDLVLSPRPDWRGLVQRHPLPPAGAADPILSRIPVTDTGRALIVASGRPEPRGHPHLAVLVGLYNKPLLKHLDDLRNNMLISLAGCILLAATGGWFLVGRSLRPMDQLVADLDRIEGAEASARLPVAPTGDEIERIRRAINGMLARIESSIVQMSSFTGDAAHELRTPVTALRCGLEVAARQGRTAEEYQQALENALQQCTRLSSLVNNLMVLARLDAAGSQVEGGPVALDAVVADVEELFRVSAEAKGLRMRLGPPCGCTVEGNADLLRQLLGNLLDNAIRYTPSGGQVSIERTAEEDACVLRVRDTGVGIPPDAQRRIFDRFFRAHPARERASGGAGLGLSICRRIAELHDGVITVQSEPGKGSVFTVRLPRSPTEAGTRPASRGT